MLPDLADAILAHVVANALTSELAVTAIREAVEDDPSLCIVPSAWRRHVVRFETWNFYLEHSIDCRIAGLRNCPIHAALALLGEPPMASGRYWVDLVGEGLVFEGEA